MWANLLKIFHFGRSKTQFAYVKFVELVKLMVSVKLDELYWKLMRKMVGRFGE